MADPKVGEVALEIRGLVLGDFFGSISLGAEDVEDI